MGVYTQIQQEIKKENEDKIRGLLKKTIRSADEAVSKRDKWINERKRQLEVIATFLDAFKNQVDAGEIISYEDIDELFSRHEEAKNIIVNGVDTDGDKFY